MMFCVFVGGHVVSGDHGGGDDRRRTSIFQRDADSSDEETARRAGADRQKHQQGKTSRTSTGFIQPAKTLFLS